MSIDDFSNPKTTFQIGVAPLRIDVICNIDGLTFDQAYETSVHSIVDEEVPVRYISLENLIRGSGRVEPVQQHALACGLEPQLFLILQRTHRSQRAELMMQRIKKQKGDKTMDIKRVGTQPSGRGPADWFTGTVRIDPLFQAPDPALVAGASVTFEPGARTAWHTHPLGQTLIVTAGAGWAQLDGGPIQPIHPGDVIWFAAGEKHWHGATATTAMTHIAIQERLDGKVVDWMEHVTDEDYLKAV